MRYGDIVAVLLAAFQKQKAELAALAERVGETASATFDTLFARKIVVNLGEFDRIVARDEVRTDGRLCLEDLCITRADLAAILENQTGQGVVESPTPAAPMTPEPALEPEPDTSEVTSDSGAPIEEVSEPDESTLPDEAGAQEPGEQSAIDGTSIDEESAAQPETEPSDA